MSQNSLFLLQNRIVIVLQAQLIDRQRQSRQTCGSSGKEKTANKKEKPQTLPLGTQLNSLGAVAVSIAQPVEPWGAGECGARDFPITQDKGFPYAMGLERGITWSKAMQTPRSLFCCLSKPNQHRQ